MTSPTTHSSSALRSYRAFGLRISSNLRLPGVLEAHGVAPADVHFQLCSEGWPEKLDAANWKLVHEVPDPDGIGGPVIAVDRSPDGLCRVTYVDGHRYYLSANGTRVWACAPPSAHTADTVSYFLGPILGLLLRMRGIIVLHASAVVVGSKALVLLGPSGAGKSTLAASLVSLGHKLVTDDLLPLTTDGGSVYGQPGYGCIRLWADSARVLVGAGVELPPVSPSWDKKNLDPRTVGSDLAEQAVPLSVIYLLRERNAELDKAEIEPIPRRAAAIHLLANTFAAPLVPPHLRGNELLVLGRLAETLPLRAITIPDALATQAQTGQLLLQDVRRET